MTDVKDLAEYQKTLLDVREVEKEIESFFTELARSQSMRFDRCRDHGERGVGIFIPYDQLNPESLSAERLATLRDAILRHISLRMLQRKIELKVDAAGSTDGVNRMMIGGGIS